jgi:serine/threonine-protein kinase
VPSSSEYPTEALSYGVAARFAPDRSAEDGRFPAGTVLAQRYRIASRLAKGGMGEVYRAIDLLLGQTVALKFLPEALLRSQPALERLRNEVRVARRISHPNVCRVYDIGEGGGQIFLAMEFIDGEDLSSLLRRVGRLTQDKALQIAKGICAGLAAAHETGVLHRDLKPSNIMIDGRGQALITDFGLATAAGSVNPADLRSGTPAYMSPEQLAGIEVTERSDIYSLGLVLYELFTGTAAFPNTGMEDLVGSRRSGPSPMPEVAANIDLDIERVILKCLDSSPARRPPTAVSVAAALPGGDPLAAAIAGRETPSPDLVATAESIERMSPRVATLCLIVLVTAFLMTARVADSSSVFASLAPDNEAGAMAQTARDMLAMFGYSRSPEWTEWGYSVDRPTLERLRKLGGAAARRQLASENPVYFWYRASPGAIAGTGPFDYGATDKDPPVSVPGMILVRLTADRHLTYFSAIPAEQEQAHDSQLSFDWMKLFNSAKLNPERFRPAVPAWTPPVAFDARAAWIEDHTEDPVRIEAAAWHGLPVYFRVARQRVSTAATRETVSIDVIFRLLRLLLLLALATYNLRRSRGDVVGAVRFGLVIGIAVLTLHLAAISHTLSVRGYFVLVSIWGNALWAGMNSALGYLAIEPLVRRRWPHALISWTRLLKGRFGDPLVAQHILIGLTLGTVVALTASFAESLVFGVVSPWPVLISSSATRVATGLLGVLPNAALDGASLYCLLLVAGTLLRNRWAGAAVIAILMALLSADPGHWVWTFLVLLLLFGTGAAFALRYGLLTLFAAMFVFTIKITFPLTMNHSAIYFGPSLAALTTVIGLGFLEYHYSVTLQPRLK